MYKNKIVSGNPTANLKAIASALVSGNLVVFPTETVYGLGADALNYDAVYKIYKAKARPISHPLIVHISSIDLLEKWTRCVTQPAMKLAEFFWPGPLTLILPRSKIAKNFITGNQDTVAIRVPAHPIAQKLLREFELQGGLGVAAPSANRFGKVSPTTAGAAKKELSFFLSETDIILDGGRCKIGIESTIIDCLGKTPKILRPGAITSQMITNRIGIKLEIIDDLNKINSVRVSGQFDSHYSPRAKVFLSGIPEKGDGFLALAHFKTPKGLIRLANPDNNQEFARDLYEALRLADNIGLEKVFIVPAIGSGISIAINDRLKKMSYK